MVKRTGWRIDLKWVSAIIFTLDLLVTLIFYNLTQFTSKKQAKEIFSPMINEALGERLGESYSKLQAWTQTFPGQEMEIPGLPGGLSLKASDVTQKSEEEFKDYLAGIIFEKAYEEGFSTKLFQQETKEERPGFAAPLIGLFSRATHLLFRFIFIIAVVFSLVFLIPFLIFSYRFGKLVNLGLSFFMVGFPGYLLFLVLSLMNFGFLGTSTKTGKAELTTPLTKMIGMVQGTHLIVLLLGIALIFLGSVGRLIYALKNTSS